MTLDDILRQIFGNGGGAPAIGGDPVQASMAGEPPMYDPVARRYASEAPQMASPAPRLPAGGQTMAPGSMPPVQPGGASPPPAARPAANADPLSGLMPERPATDWRHTLGDVGLALQGRAVPDRAAMAREAEQGRLRANLTYRAMIGNGIPAEVAQAAIANPEIAKQVIGQMFAKPEQPKYQTVGGKIIAIGPGGAKVAYEDQAKRDIRQVGKRLVEVMPDGTAKELYAPPDGSGLADNLTVGEKAVDKQFAKTYEDLVVSGGAADVQKNLTALRDVRGQLTDPKGSNLSGPEFSLVPDPIQDVISPKVAAARQNVEEVVQRNLRIILGAQFTNEEGKRLIARAYNVNQPEAENAKRLERLTAAMEAMLKAKLDAATYFERHGTLKGFRGAQQFSVADLEAAMDGGKKGDADPEVARALKEKWGLE